MAGNYFAGNSVFNSLSNVFGNPTSGNTAEAKPIASSTVTKVEGYMKKQVFGIPLWIILVVAIVVVILVMVV